jgi:hypothetical protein
MNAYLRKHVAGLFLLLPVATAIVALPGAAMAQTAAPELRSLQIGSDGGFSPGAQLVFTAEGTARAQSHIRIDGVSRDIALKETSRGVYTGSYTIARQDRLVQSSPIRVTLQSGSRSVVANYTFPPGMAPAPVADLAKVSPRTLKIERFTVAPIENVDPGAELRFSLTGMPGGRAEVEIPGLSKSIPLKEVRSGVYEGGYTVRQQDKLTPSRPLVAKLSQGEKSVKVSLTKAWVSEANASPIHNMLPRENANIPDQPKIPISASFDEASGIDPKSVRIVVSGRNVTAGSKITSKLVTYPANLQPGRHTVEVTARDRAGNTLRKGWSFNVVTPASADLRSERCN